jgi:hypothetical protein
MDIGLVITILAAFSASALPIVLYRLRDRRIATHFKAYVEHLGITNVRNTWGGFGVALKGSWNGMPVHISMRPPHGESQSKMMIFKLEIDLKQPGRFYLRNRARPLIYDWAQRPISRWVLPKETSFSNKEDNSLFAANTVEPEVVDRLLNSVAARKQILRNVIDSDGELVLEGGKLKILRMARMNLKTKDEASLHQIEKILREEWDLLRTVTAVLRPLQLHVSDRSAAEVECPFCKSELNELASLVRCASCNTYHHQTCFMENGRCSVYGCVGFAVPVLKSAPAQETERS